MARNVPTTDVRLQAHLAKIVLSLFVSLPPLCLAGDFDHFQNILNKHLVVTQLTEGGLQTAFNYDDAYKNPETMTHVKQQAEHLSKFDLKALKNKDQANAFWINAYNFFMIKIILDKGFEKGKRNVDSVKDFGSFFNPYKIFKQEIINIAGKKYSLDKIEKGTLLGEEYKKMGWKDARIHFAVNCASVGCPPLVKQIYSAKQLNKQLDDNIKKAFKTPRHLKLADSKLYLTHLFKWYKSDFEEHSGSIQNFILKYVDNPEKASAIKKAKKTKYIDYDWKLNIPRNFK